MKSRAIKKYCRTLSRQLVCSRQTKARLLQGIQEELLAAEDGISPETVCGEACQVAQELQWEIPGPEREACQKRRRRLEWAVIFGAVLLVGTLILLLILLRHGFADRPFEVIDVIYATRPD